ncbi:putative DNA-binding protein, partial [Gordonia neofelifaecis NRRL B-59395]
MCRYGLFMTTAQQRGVIPTLTESQRLTVARQYVGLSQTEFATMLGVSTATVQRAESGVTRPRRTTFMAWSMATGVDLHWLETGEAPSPDGDGASQGCAIRDSNPEPAD